jgi:hypothetical protein
MEPFVPACNRELTKPKSPTFATEQRMRLKDDFKGSDSHSQKASDFKAKPLNKKIFEEGPKLPEVEKRLKTTFDEFQLSKSNGKLGKRSLIEY